MQWPVLPDYGIIIRWPEDGQDFIHPSDLQVALKCIPSERLLRRESFDGEYYRYRYGKATFRLRPIMWRTIAHEGIDVGDEVEIIGLGMEREKFVAHVWGMHYIRRRSQIVYRLRRADRVMQKLYTIDQMRLIKDKQTVRDAGYVHQAPTWKGDQSGDRLPAG